MKKSLQISDEELVGWIINGDLTVPLDNPTEITLFGRSNKVYENGTGGFNSSGSRFSFGFENKKRRRTIVRAKLVWMAGAKRIVPDGFQIHHDDLDRYNDEYGNLLCLFSDDHEKVHSRISSVEMSSQLTNDADPFPF